MFALLRRKPNRRPPAPLQRARLGLERLEARDCPAGPTLTLTALPLPGHLVQLSGQVMDSQPAGVRVTFSGSALGSTTTDNSGRYSFQTSSAVLGTVYAIGQDTLGRWTNTASALIAVAAPIVNLSVSYGTQRTVTLSGTVTDLDPGNRTVSFSGVVSGTATTRADGTFSLVTQASGLGNVFASTVNLWSLVSNVAQLALQSQAPVISNFTAAEGPNHMWTFSGNVQDESATALVVTLGGIPSLQGQTVTVDSQGHFSLTLCLQPGESGTATAVTTDWWGLESNEALAIVRPTS